MTKRLILKGKNIPPVPKRDEISCKTDFGTVAALTGSAEMTGAAVLCGNAVLRCGAGLLLQSGEKTLLDVVRLALPEAICVSPERFFERVFTSCVIGCGIGRAYDAILPQILLSLKCPTVLDADGINFVSLHKDIIKNMHCDLIMTPHPGEMSRLTRLSVTEIQNDRENIARDFAAEYGCITVLKGHNTVIALPDKTVFIDTTGGSELAKGGSGDVLAGIIASLCAQGMSASDAALLGVHTHSAAGKRLARQYGVRGVMPSELCAEAGRLLCRK